MPNEFEQQSHEQLQPQSTTLDKHFQYDTSLSKKGIDISSFAKQQKYWEEEVRELEKASQSALQVAQSKRDAPNEAEAFLQTLYKNLSVLRKKVQVKDITNTLSQFFTNPDSELEDYGLLTDYVLDARANRLKVEAQQVNVQKQADVGSLNASTTQTRKQMGIAEWTTTEHKESEAQTNEKVIEWWRGYLDNLIAQLSEDIPLLKDAKQLEGQLDEKTSEQLAKHGISPTKYLTIAHMYNNLDKAEIELPPDLFQELKTNEVQFVGFEKALWITRPYQSLEAIKPSPNESNLSRLREPEVYNNIEELYESVDTRQALWTQEYYTKNLVDDAHELLQLFPNILIKGQGGKYQLDTLQWENISHLFGDDKDSETVKQGLADYQLLKEAEGQGRSIDENGEWYQKAKLFLDNTSQIIA